MVKLGRMNEQIIASSFSPSFRNESLDKRLRYDVRIRSRQIYFIQRDFAILPTHSSSPPQQL